MSMLKKLAIHKWQFFLLFYLFSVLTVERCVEKPLRILAKGLL